VEQFLERLAFQLGQTTVRGNTGALVTDSLDRLDGHSPYNP